MPVGRRLLDYIDILWSEDNNFFDVQAYLEPLIKEAVEKARSEKVPELDAKPITHDRLNQVQTRSAIQHGDVPHQAMMSLISGESRPVDDAPGGGIPSEFSNQPEKHRYTSRLHEVGAQNSVKPTYKYTQVSDFPSSWKCQLRFGDSVEEATAGSTKSARHEASYQLCTRLGINIE